MLEIFLHRLMTWRSHILGMMRDIHQHCRAVGMRIRLWRERLQPFSDGQLTSPALSFILISPDPQFSRYRMCSLLFDLVSATSGNVYRVNLSLAGGATMNVIIIFGSIRETCLSVNVTPISGHASTNYCVLQQLYPTPHISLVYP